MENIPRFLTLKIIGILILIIGLTCAAFLISNNQTPQTEEPSSTQQVDFSNNQEGTFIGTLQAEYFKEPIDQVVVMFVSAKIPGLTLIYYPYENKLVGGSPQMVANNVIFFDGIQHHLAYTFKENGEQILIYDDNIVGQSPFQAPQNSPLTGAVTGITETGVSAVFLDTSFS